MDFHHSPLHSDRDGASLCAVGPKLSTETDISTSSRGDEPTGNFICRICEKSHPTKSLRTHTIFCTLQTQLDFHLTRWLNIREELESVAKKIHMEILTLEAARFVKKEREKRFCSETSLSLSLSKDNRTQSPRRKHTIS